MRAAWLWTMVMLLGCGGPSPGVRWPLQAPPRDESALRAAADAYYAAADVPALRSAVAQARQAGPESALYHEIAADLARFEAYQEVEHEHLLGALLDPANDSALVHLYQLDSMSWTLDQRTRSEDVLRAVANGHPRSDVRALASAMWASSLHLRGDFEGRELALRGTDLRLPFALIGTFDNDQGKGFDAEQPPEREIDLAGRYRGRLVDVGWRTTYVSDPRGRVDLAALFEPDRWQVVYAVAAVSTPGGDYELRLASSDPVKVWINDVLVFAGRRVDAWLPDGIVLPVRLRAGTNRVLVKSAQEEGTWWLSARLTGPDGASAAGVRVVAPGSEYEAGERPVEAPLVDTDLLARRVADLPPGPRRDHHHALWAELSGLRVPAVERADAFLAGRPGSLTARQRLATALWSNNERDRAADLLGALARDAAPLVYPRLQQARFWRQQNLDEKARTLLLSLAAEHPDRPAVQLRLAEVYEAEGWREDRCATLEAADRRWPRWPAVRLELADCLQSLQLRERAGALHRAILAELPNSQAALSGLQWLALSEGDFAAATEFGRRLVAGWPDGITARERLAETLRRAGDSAGAEAELRGLVDMAPTDPLGHTRLAELTYQLGRRDEAIAHWREALDRDPENEKLANRLDFLAPAERGPWMADVPSEAALDAAVKTRDALRLSPGANVVYLLDDEVTELRADGSTVNFVTMVAHAVNDAGRDQLTQMRLRSGGRARLMHAWAVGPDGRRVEASSIRGREVRFRQLQSGSTVVLQYRLDSPPDGYLAGHMARQWWFQGTGVQTVVGRWVLWMPSAMHLRESILGPVERKLEPINGLTRGVWSVKDQPPLVSEPGMPTAHEVMAHVLVSTVPDWDMFLRWEEALLQDVFRVGPEVEALATRLFDGAPDAMEKLRRVQAFLINEIRYQQDYDRPIAGVKPHAAPVVLERRYGDCKDKAVLFITLARLAGLEVHFALVRTRDAGPAWREVPMQQFNHAIVYVPSQPGVPEARFYDPTVDALDVDVLRHDDQGTWSMVYEPLTGEHTWRLIPFQEPALDFARLDTTLRFALDGTVAGEGEASAQGTGASALRRTARNPEQFAQLLQTQLASTYAGVRVERPEPLQVTDIRQPARVRVRFEAPAVGRREGDTLRFKVPIAWSPQGWFSLAERRFPLLLGTPRTLSWRVELVPPPGARVARLPASGEVKGGCMTLERRVTPGPTSVVVEQTVRVTCERVEPEAYARHRELADQMTRLLEQELVWSVRATVGAGRSATR